MGGEGDDEEVEHVDGDADGDGNGENAFVRVNNIADGAEAWPPLNENAALGGCWLVLSAVSTGAGFEVVGGAPVAIGTALQESEQCRSRQSWHCHFHWIWQSLEGFGGEGGRTTAERAEVQDSQLLLVVAVVHWARADGRATSAMARSANARAERGMSETVS